MNLDETTTSNPTATPTPAPKPKRVRKAKAKAKKKVAKSKPRKVHGANGAKTGRPMVQFKVKLLSNGKFKVNTKSLRRELITWLEGRSGKSATIAEIESKFKRNMRGVVRQLVDSKWLSRAAGAE